MDEKALLKTVEDNKEQMLDGICRIVSIDSEKDEPSEHAPFGKKVRHALDETMKLAQELGFETEIVNDCVGIAKYGQGDDSDYIGVLGHLDVVPAGEGWTTSPYEPDYRDGRIYARGILDNKGPIIANLYALYALKENGLKPKHPIWIMFGTNEETGMEDIPSYLSAKMPPIAGYTPDCKFPVVYAERGRMVVKISFDTTEKLHHWLNLYLLANRPKEAALKLDVVDPEFGKLEIRNTVIDGNSISFALSYPPCIEADEIVRRLEKTLHEGESLEVVSDWKPVFFNKEGVLCRTLQDAYEELTGLDGRPVTTTGGTYAKRMPNIVPFGPSFPGQKGIGHLPDEWMNVDDLVTNAKIYALSLARLSQEDL